MILTRVAIGLAILVVVALLLNYRARIGAEFTAIGNRIRTIRYGDTSDPVRWMNWYLRTHLLPLQMRARQATEAAQRVYTRATEGVASAVAAFPGGAPGGMAAMGMVLGLVVWVLVASANGALDFSLNLAFSRNVLLAILLTMLTVSLPLLLAEGAQTVFRHRPTRAGRDIDDESWGGESFRSAIIGLVVVYVVLFAFMGFLGVTRAERVYENNVRQAATDYTSQVTEINQRLGAQIRTAELTQTQDVSDGADATLQQFDADAVTALKDDLQTELTAAATTRDTYLENLKTNQSGDATKWIAFAVGASVAEAASAYAVKNGLLLIRLGLARRRQHEADNKWRAAQAAAERVGTDAITRMARILQGAHVDAAVFDRWLRDRGLLRDERPTPPEIGEGEGPGPVPPEGPVIVEPLPPDPPTEPVDPTPAPPEDDIDDTTPGFDEA